MGFNRPSDIAIILGIGILVLITFGYGMASVSELQGIGSNNTVFTSASNSIGSYQNTSNSASAGLASSSGVSETPNQDSIGTASFNAILSLGRMVSDSIGLLSDITTKFFIPKEFLVVIIGLLLVVFAVVTYSWFRGSVLL